MACWQNKMLNENRTFEKKELIQFSLLNEDIYQFQLFDVNYENNINKNTQEMEKQLAFTFVCLSGVDKDGGNARLRIMTKKYVPTSLYISKKNGKNPLYRIVESLIGRELNAEEEAKGISEKTINFLVETNKQLRALVENKPMSEGRTYQNLVKFLPATTPINILTSEEIKKVKESLEKINKKHSENKPVDNFTAGMSDDEIPAELKPENVPF